MINLTQTTSASYLLLSSLDISSAVLALRRRDLSQYARIGRLCPQGDKPPGGYYAYAKELCNGEDFFAFDRTKLSVYTRDIGLAGIEVYDMLRDLYDIQIEFGDIGNILAIITAGDRWKDIERLVSALSEIKRRFCRSKAGMLDHEYINPTVKVSPTRPFYSRQTTLPIRRVQGAYPASSSCAIRRAYR